MNTYKRVLGQSENISVGLIFNINKYIESGMAPVLDKESLALGGIIEV